MSKYYKFRYDAGYPGSEDSAVYRFPDGASRESVLEQFDDWYSSRRTDTGDVEEISEEEAEEYGIVLDLDPKGPR